MKYLVCILCALFAVSCSGGDGKVSPRLEEALFHYHRGQAYQQQGNNYEAMEEFLEAEQLSAATDRYVLQGQICWFKGKIYADKLDYSNALDMFLKAKSFFERTSAREPLMYTYEQMGHVYSANGSRRESIHYYDSARKIAQELRDKMLYSPHDSLVSHKENFYNGFLMDCAAEIASEYSHLPGGDAQALSILKTTYDKFNDSLVNPADYPLLAQLHLNRRDLEGASRCLGKYDAYLQQQGTADLLPDKLAEFYSLYGRVAELKGDYRLSAQYLQKYIGVKDSLSQEVRRESVREAEQQFWQRRLEEENYRIKTKGYYMGAIYALGFLFMAIAFAAIYYSYREKFRIKDAQLAEYAEAVDSLGVRVSSAESSRMDLLSELDVQKERERELKELLENRFAEVRELLRTYYEFGNSKKLQKKVDDLLKLQLSGDNFEVIEQVVNAKNNGVIRKVREKYPNMKEENIKLLNLIYAGFSAQEISVILNDSPQNIYVRKSRLKKSIQELIHEDAQMNFS